MITTSIVLIAPLQVKIISKSSRLIGAPLHKKALSQTYLDEMFKDTKDKEHRNMKIKEAAELGYSQHKIAKALNLTQAMVSLVLKGKK